MENFNLTHQYMYTVDKYLKIHYYYFNHTKENHYLLLKKGVKRWQIRRLGSGYNMIQLQKKIILKRRKKEL